MTFREIEIKPSRTHLHGASSAQADMAEIRPLFSTLGTQPVVVFFDFRGAESITGSYLRATVLWSLLSGREFAEGATNAASQDNWSIRPLPLYPVVAAQSDEILDEIDDFLKQRDQSCLATRKPGPIPFSKATLLGTLDGFLAETLKLLEERGPSVAQDLTKASTEKISIGGWSNRLAALHSRRLVTRIRDGKTWIYQALSTKHTPWA